MSLNKTDNDEHHQDYQEQLVEEPNITKGDMINRIDGDILTPAVVENSSDTEEIVKIKHLKTAKGVQQEFANICGTRDAIIWDLFSIEQKDVLIKKITVLYPDLRADALAAILLKDDISEEDMKKVEIELKKIRKYNKELKIMRNKLIDNIWTQRKYNNGDLLASIVFVILTSSSATTEKLESAIDVTEDLFTCHPLIRIRKCVNENDSRNCCMIFVDDKSRVYKNWNDFIENNEYDNGILVVPHNGIYDFNESNQVVLDCFPSPSSKLSQKAMKITDNVAVVSGIGAAAVPIGALLMPVALPLLAGASIIGASVALWSVGRSASNLFDRGQHEQSLNVSDRQARSSWIGLTGGLIGLGATSATHGLAKYALSGEEISKVVQGTVNTMNITSITVNGLGVGNGILDLVLKCRDEEEIGALDVVQLSASLLLFTHSVYNLRYASAIVESIQDGKPKSFKTEFSKQQRMRYDKVARQSVRFNAAKKVDIIRGLGIIPEEHHFLDLKEYNSFSVGSKSYSSNIIDSKQFNSLNKLNTYIDSKSYSSNLVDSKQLNPLNAYHGSKSYNLNLMDSNQLRPIIACKSSWTGESNFPSTEKSSSIPRINPNFGIKSHQPSSNISQYITSFTFNPSLAMRASQFTKKILEKYFVQDEHGLKNCFSRLFKEFEEDIVKYFLNIAEQFCKNFLKDFEKRINQIFGFEHVLHNLYGIAKQISEKRQMSIDRNFFDKYFDEILNELKLFYGNLIKTSNGEKVKCKLCNGFYIISKVD